VPCGCLLGVLTLPLHTTICVQSQRPVESLRLTPSPAWGQGPHAGRCSCASHASSLS
jgi:hypothetical protein